MIKISVGVRARVVALPDPPRRQNVVARRAAERAKAADGGNAAVVNVNSIGFGAMRFLRERSGRCRMRTATGGIC